MVDTSVFDNGVRHDRLVLTGEVASAAGAGLEVGHASDSSTTERSSRTTPRAYLSGGHDAVVDEASITASASPDPLWGLVTDVTQMGRWSPECRRCTWMDDASGPRVGARFKGHNKRGVLRWSSVATVVVADEPEHFAFVDPPDFDAILASAGRRGTELDLESLPELLERHALHLPGL